METDEPHSESGDGELNHRDETGFSPFVGRAASVVAMVVLSVVILLLGWQMITLLLVLFLGVLLAIFLRGLTQQLVRYTAMNDTLALVVIAVILVVIFGGSGWLMAPAISTQATEIADKIPEALDELQYWLEEVPAGQRLMGELAEVELAEIFRGAVLGPLGGALFGVAGAISHAVFVLFVGIYFAYDPRVYKRGMVRMVPMHYRERAEEIIAVSVHQLAWWLIGRLLAMLGVAVMVTIGLWLLGIPLPIFLGLIAGLLSFVPILGPIVSAIPAALVALLVGPEFVLWTILVFIGAQAVESYVITPMVQHRFVSLPHAMTLIAEIFAGILFGVIGITVATPLAVLLMALINMIYVEDVLGDTTPFTDLAAEYG